MEIKPILRFLPALLLTSYVSAQAGLHFGSIEIPHIDSDEIQIRQDGKEWRIDLTNLTRVNDCYGNYTGNGNERICTGPPRSPCPACPSRMADVIAWDERRQKLYFVIGNGGWQSRPWTVFNYNLVTHRVTRFGNTFATAMGEGTVSPSGQYLAYVQIFHCSPGYNGHCPSDAIEVMDLWTRRIAGRPNDITPNHDVITITHLTWSSPSKLVYTGSAQSFNPEPQPEHPTEGSIDVRGLQFR